MNNMSDQLPVSNLHCAIYLLSIIQQNNSLSAVTTAFYSLRYAHCSMGLQSPTDNGLVKNVMEAAKRRLSKPVVKKEPVTADILERLYDSRIENASLVDLRILSMFLLAYSGFLRSAELLNLTRTDIVFYVSYMTVFIEKSKTDIYRDGAWLVISRLHSKLCPVECLDRYFKAADILPDSSEYIFRNLSKCYNGYKLRDENKSMSYTRLRELFKEALSPFVPDIGRFGLHSLRSGGATAAANNGIPDRMFKRHGRWRSENAKDGYVKDSILKRMEVSLSLNL